MDEQDWATAIRVTAKLVGEPRFEREDAMASIQAVTHNVTLSGDPREIFSIGHFGATAASQSFEAGTRAIEDIYGQYVPGTRQLEIFVRRISQDHRTFSSSFSDLLTVVRLHEHAHAIVHLGVFAGDVPNLLSTMTDRGVTDWDRVLATRDEAFTQIDTQTHELLAQALTWACVSQRREDTALAETFLALQARQPEKYQFDPAFKLGAASADWPLILKAARGETDVYREEGFALVKGIAALLQPTANEEVTAVEPPAVMEFLSQTQKALANVDLLTEPSSADPRNIAKLLIARRGQIELRMYKETGHRRPHFHIEYKKEYSASYALDSFELLAGFMPRRYEEAMIPIARTMRDELFATWHELHGTLRAKLGAPGSAA